MDNQYEAKIEEAVKEAVDSSYYESDTSSSLAYDPFGADLDCGDFASQSVAQTVYEAAGGPSQNPHDLDWDKDEVACDAN